MHCHTPMDIKNPHGGNDPTWVKVPCGNCPICKSNNRNQWSFRLSEEARASDNCFFVTMTYDDDNLPYNAGYPTLNKPHVSNYVKAIRQKQARELKKTKEKFQKIRFYAVGEYGGNYRRPHYHMLLFNITEATARQLEKIWKMGYVDVQIGNKATIHYVTKYMMDKDQYPEDSQRPFTLMSQGIGKQYLERARRYHLENLVGHTKVGEYQHNLSKYYKNKLFNEDQKKKSMIKRWLTFAI